MKLSIIVPYLSRSKAFPIFKEMLYDNTTNEFELIEIVNSRDVYGAYNKGALQATGDIIVCINDDMFLDKGWDEMVVKYTQPYTVVTFLGLIEREQSYTHRRSIIKDFGSSPDTFNRKLFEVFCAEIKKDAPEAIQGTGWLQPFAILRSNWIPYPNKMPYPEPNDIDYFQEILPRYGFNFLIVRSFCYHLQNYSKELV